MWWPVNLCLLLVLFLTTPYVIKANPVAGPEISHAPNKQINSLTIQQPLQHQQQQQQQLQQQLQQQHQHQHQHQQHQQVRLNNNLPDVLLNSLSVYATNYDVIADKQNPNEKFKASYKLPEMETNFTPIQSANSITPEFASSLAATHAPVLMQYLPQTINEGGIQYLQLIPTRPLMVPLGSYMTGNNGLSSLAYHQQLTANSGIDYAGRPLMSAMPMTMPPPAPTPIVDVAASPLPSYGIQPYAGGMNHYKQSHRINRETKSKPLLGPISLNLNEYLPQGNHQPHATFHIQGRS